MSDKPTTVSFSFTAVSFQSRPITEEDLPWPQLLKMAQENAELLKRTEERLIKCRKQKNEWKRLYEEVRYKDLLTAAKKLGEK